MYGHADGHCTRELPTSPHVDQAGSSPVEIGALEPSAQTIAVLPLDQQTSERSTPAAFSHFAPIQAQGKPFSTWSYGKGHDAEIMLARPNAN